MAENTEDSLKMIKDMDREYSNGEMEERIEDHGLTENNMELGILSQ